MSYRKRLRAYRTKIIRRYHKEHAEYTYKYDYSAYWRTQCVRHSAINQSFTNSTGHTSHRGRWLAIRGPHILYVVSSCRVASDVEWLRLMQRSHSPNAVLYEPRPGAGSLAHKRATHPRPPPSKWTLNGYRTTFHCTPKCMVSDLHKITLIGVFLLLRCRELYPKIEFWIYASNILLLGTP